MHYDKWSAVGAPFIVMLNNNATYVNFSAGKANNQVGRETKVF